jgi:hypothetical protein
MNETAGMLFLYLSVLEVLLEVSQLSVRVGQSFL